MINIFDTLPNITIIYTYMYIWFPQILFLNIYSNDCSTQSISLEHVDSIASLTSLSLLITFQINKFQFLKFEISIFKILKFEISIFNILKFQNLKFQNVPVVASVVYTNGQSHIGSQKGNTDSRIIFRKPGETETDEY